MLEIRCGRSMDAFSRRRSESAAKETTETEDGMYKLLDPSRYPRIPIGFTEIAKLQSIPRVSYVDTFHLPVTNCMQQLVGGGCWLDTKSAGAHICWHHSAPARSAAARRRSSLRICRAITVLLQIAAVQTGQQIVSSPSPSSPDIITITTITPIISRYHHHHHHHLQRKASLPVARSFH